MDRDMPPARSDHDNPLVMRNTLYDLHVIEHQFGRMRMSYRTRLAWHGMALCNGANQRKPMYISGRSRGVISR